MRSIDATPNAIAIDRKRLQNQYAHLSDDGRYEAYACYPMRSTKKSYYTDAEIQAKVTELQHWIWDKKHIIWPDSIPVDPVEMLDPEIGIKAVGFDFQYAYSLGRYRAAGRDVEVAGIVNSDEKSVLISESFPVEVRRFTAAHELGHALLHEALGLHRDKALTGEKLSRASREWEADKFAAFYLMPSKLVATRFRQRFLTENFVPDESAAFALTRRGLREFLDLFPNRRDLARALAKAEIFNGKSFKSLAAYFGVSVETMAIRIEELNLVA